MLNAPFTIENANINNKNCFDVKSCFIEGRNSVCSTIALRLGRLAGRYVKKNTFNKVATIARQN